MIIINVVITSQEIFGEVIFKDNSGSITDRHSKTFARFIPVEKAQHSIDSLVPNNNEDKGPQSIVGKVFINIKTGKLYKVTGISYDANNESYYLSDKSNYATNLVIIYRTLDNTCLES